MESASNQSEVAAVLEQQDTTLKTHSGGKGIVKEVVLPSVKQERDEMANS